jgi:hypothetical protein
MSEIYGTGAAKHEKQRVGKKSLIANVYKYIE